MAVDNSLWTNTPSVVSRSRSDAAPLAGSGQQSSAPTGRTYVQIFRENIFTFINIVIFLLGMALVAGRPPQRCAHFVGRDLR